jgi:short-subunit dehydrogenase
MSKKPVALIIGMGPGLSLSLAHRFASSGYLVVGYGRDVSKSEPAAAALRKEGLSIELQQVDASDLSALTAAIASTAVNFGPIEVLIYNAYRATMALPSQLAPNEALADLNVNIVAPLAAAQAVLPAMIERGRGSIVFTGGGLALDPTGWLPAASLAIGKAGIRSLSQTLNEEMAPKGVHVGTVTIAGAIEPGTAFSPGKIADAYWAFVADASKTKTAEFVFKG